MCYYTYSVHVVFMYVLLIHLYLMSQFHSLGYWTQAANQLMLFGFIDVIPSVTARVKISQNVYILANVYLVHL